MTEPSASTPSPSSSGPSSSSSANQPRPPWHRRPAIWALIIAIVLVLAIGIPFAYAQYRNALAPAPFLSQTATAPATPSATPSAASTPSASASVSGSASGNSAPAAMEGRWAVADGSQAGYRVKEVLNGQDTTVVGRADQVNGSVLVEQGELTEIDIEVQMADVTTDSGARDAQYRGSIMQTNQYPTASFALSKPVPLDPGGGTVTVPGELTLKGKAVAVTATVSYAGSGSTAIADGSIPISFADWGIDPPDLGFVKVEDAGEVEFHLALTHE